MDPENFGQDTGRTFPCLYNKLGGELSLLVHRSCCLATVFFINYCTWFDKFDTNPKKSPLKKHSSQCMQYKFRLQFVHFYLLCFSNALLCLIVLESGHISLLKRKLRSDWDWASMDVLAGGAYKEPVHPVFQDPCKKQLL